MSVDSRINQRAHHIFKVVPPPSSFRLDPTSITIGNFDGIHLGHQRLLQRMLQSAAQLSTAPTVLTFDPTPQSFFAREQSAPRIFSHQQKQRALAECGVKNLIVQAFDARFRELDATGFMLQYLVAHLRVASVIVGYDFRFGKNRQGDPNLLRQTLEPMGCDVQVCGAEMHGEQPISSTHIRALLKAGDVHVANQLLGRPLALEGDIIPGQQLARTLGFPTLNILCKDQLLPRYGVYVGRLVLDANNIRMMQLPEESVPAIVNIGVRPSVDPTVTPEPLVEAHVLASSFSADLTGKRVAFYPQQFLRPEQRFANLQQLKSAIAADVEQAKTIALR